jgi:acetylornithine/succinyldiaminopimelate/putrescine aminotransferase
MKSVPLTAAAVPAVRPAIKARRTLALKIEGEPVARVQPSLTVTRKQAAQILRQIAEADKGDDWAEYGSWK